MTETDPPVRHTALAMVVICAAQFVLQLDFSIVNVALPTIQHEFGMAPADLQWIVTGYALTFGSLLLAGGRLADLLGRRRLLAAGLILFAVASLAAGLAQWPLMLIVARIVQGSAGALVTTALAALIYGLSNGQQHGFGASASLTALIASVLLMTTFIYIEGHSREPMLPLGIFAAPARRAAVVAMLMMGAILAGYVYFISLYLQRVQGFSPVETGLALVPSTLTVVVTSTFGTRRLLARLALKWVLLAGLACLAAGQLWLAQISAGASYPVDVLPGLILTALGIGLALPTASIAITSGVHGRDQGLAGALFTTSQQTGAAVGLAVLTTAAAARTTHAGGSLVAGYQLSFLIGAALAGLGAAFVAAQLRARRQLEVAAGSK